MARTVLETHAVGLGQRLPQLGDAVLEIADAGVGVADVAALLRRVPQIARLQVAVEGVLLVPEPGTRVAVDHRPRGVGQLDGRDLRGLLDLSAGLRSADGFQQLAPGGVLPAGEEAPDEPRRREHERAGGPGLGCGPGEEPGQRLQPVHVANPVRRGGDLGGRLEPGPARARQERHALEGARQGGGVLAAPLVGLGLQPAQPAELFADSAAGHAALGAGQSGGEVVALQRLLGGAAVPGDCPQRLPPRSKCSARTSGSLSPARSSHSPASRWPSRRSSSVSMA